MGKLELTMTLQARVFLLLPALALAIGLHFPAVAAMADGHGIEVTAMAAENQFPDGIKFSVSARSPNEIDDIRVFFRKVDGPAGSAYRTVDFEPGKSVTGEAFLRSAGGTSYIPPGTKIKYSFEVLDKAGGVLRTPEQEILYTDTRFDWRTLSSGLITVFYHGEDAEEKARTVLEAADQALERMSPVLGIAPTEPLRIITYNNYREMVLVVPFRSRATSEQLQTQGIAFSDERVLLVLGLDPTVRGTVSHEFTHLLVAEATGRAHTQVPAWLNEGLAEYGNIDQSDEYPTALRFAISSGRLKPLWYLRTFTGTPRDIIIAYGQSRSVIQYMVDRYGAAKMGLLLRAFRETLDIDESLERVYGLDRRQLDSEWRESLGLDPLPTPEELERQNQEINTSPTATSVPTPTSIPTPTPVRTPTPVPTPTSTPKPTLSPVATPAVSSQDDGTPKTSAGCGAGNASGTVADLTMLFLLAGPLAALCARGLRRRPPSL